MEASTNHLERNYDSSFILKVHKLYKLFILPHFISMITKYFCTIALWALAKKGSFHNLYFKIKKTRRTQAEVQKKRERNDIWECRISTYRFSHLSSPSHCASLVQCPISFAIYDSFLGKSFNAERSEILHHVSTEPCTIT